MKLINFKHAAILLFLVLLICSGCSPASAPGKALIEAPAHGAEQLILEAQETYDSGLYSLARSQFEKIQDEYPSGYWSAYVELKVADCYLFAGDYSEAEAAYEKFVANNPGHEAISYAVFQTAVTQLKQYKGAERDQEPLRAAKATLDSLLRNHASSQYVLRARDLLSRIDEEQARHEIFVAEYYIRRENFDSARTRLESLLSNYGETSLAPKAERLLLKLSNNPAPEVLPLGVKDSLRDEKIVFPPELVAARRIPILNGYKPPKTLPPPELVAARRFTT